MIRIFSSPNLIEITQLKDLLERDGITAMVRNDFSYGYAGYGALGVGHHELWVPEDQEAQSLEVKRDWEEAA